MSTRRKSILLVEDNPDDEATLRALRNFVEFSEAVRLGIYWLGLNEPSRR